MGPSLSSLTVRRRLFLLLRLTLLVSCAVVALPAGAQVQTFMNKPGSNVGPSTKIKPVNCVTAADGAVTCDTQIENSPSDTPAKPIYQPFKN